MGKADEVRRTMCNADKASLWFNANEVTPRSNADEATLTRQHQQGKADEARL